GGWFRSDYDDSAWKTTDCTVETWSTLGMHNFLGAVWYRTQVELPPVPAGKKIFLWMGATDGRVKVFVNGRHVSFVNDKGGRTESFAGFCQPVSCDITSVIQAGAKNHIAILCTREAI